MTNYTPPNWRKNVNLRDGTSLHLRPIRPDDTGRIRRFYERLSLESTYFRFMSMMKRLTEMEVEHFTRINFDDEMAIVGVVPDEEEPGGERLIAVGQYVRLPKPTHAEVAFAVNDAYQGRGIATHLLQELLPFARMADIEVLEAEVLAENKRMLQVFRNMGFTTSTERFETVIHIEFPIESTALSREQRWMREQSAGTAAMQKVFRPQVVAVVGASTRPGSIGNSLVRNLLQQEFNGAVFPVNPKHRAVCSVQCYPSLLEIPLEVDLAIIAVPAAQVMDVARDCARKRVHAIVVISAGFAESGGEGAELQEELLEFVRLYGMRMVGPNCLGLVNTEAGVRLNATFSPVYPPMGRVAFSSQSGALGIAILDLARELRLGLSQFVSVGNKADISGNDLLYYWGTDNQTDVILLYLESFGNPKKFSRIARSVSRNKPIVVLKSGTSQAGARAASSHTGAIASSNIAARTLMAQAGIIQTDSMEKLFNAAKVLGSQPLPKGPRLAILTNAGGPAILSADRAELEGLVVRPCSESLQQALQQHLAPAAHAGNPVDMIASATAEQYETCLNLLLKSDEVDQVLVLFIPPMVTTTVEVAQAMIRARHACGNEKPLVASILGSQGETECHDILAAERIPTFRFPEDAVVALAQLHWYANWRNTPEGDAVRFDDVDRSTADAIMAEATSALAEGEMCWLPTDKAFRVLEAYGIPVIPTRFAPDAEAAVAAAHKVGFPVAMKLASTTIVHKTDVGGVVLDVPNEPELRKAFADLAARLEAEGRRGEMDGVIVQPMSRSGLETVLGVSHDPLFGPVMMAGLGGIYLDLFRDVQFSLHPLTDRSASEMLASLKSSRLFAGYRGARPRDLPALREVLLRLSQLVAQHPEIKDVDLNPVMVLANGEGCRVVDARIQLAHADQFTEWVISQLDD